MNRKLLLGAAFFFAGINMSAASDLPVSYDSDWSGLYATLSAGYSNVKLDGEQTFIETEVDKQSSDGLIFGVGAGYNHDLGDFVIGLEGDISLLGNDNTLEMKNTVDAEYDWFATGRLRAGYDFDGTLLYATGGVAALAADFDDDIGFSDGKTFVGWTVGGGLDHMITDSLSLRLEGLYVDLPNKDVDLGNQTEIEPEMFLVRAGISWRFLSP